jgi:hypothetical protein
MQISSERRFGESEVQKYELFVVPEARVELWERSQSIETSLNFISIDFLIRPSLSVPFRETPQNPCSKKINFEKLTSKWHFLHRNEWWCGRISCSDFFPLVCRLFSWIFQLLHLVTWLAQIFVRCREVTSFGFISFEISRSNGDSKTIENWISFLGFLSIPGDPYLNFAFIHMILCICDF